MENSFSFILLHISTLLVLLMAVVILRMKNKSHIQYIFLGYILFITLWSVGLLLETYALDVFNNSPKIFMYITHLGLFFLPVQMLLIGLFFARTKSKYSWKLMSVYIIPMISMLILITNDYHKLFYVKYSINMAEIIYGKYFIVDAVYSYSCILIGLYCLVYFSIKNSGFFSKQSVLIVAGSVIPLIVNIMATLKVIPLSVYVTPSSFSFTIIFYALAIFKFNFLNIVPVALQNVVDRISDSFIVVNQDLKIVDYNKTFIDSFSYLYKIKRNDNLNDVINANPSAGIDMKKLNATIKRSSIKKKPIIFENHITYENFDKYYSVEVTPIIANDVFIGTIILLKDITKSKMDLQSVKEKQAVLMQERLVSMGQLIGGIAHNLKTPIMSLSGGIEALKDLVDEYEESIGDSDVTEKDHHEIAEEMRQWLEKMKPYCSYMSDIISSVKGQAVQLNASSTNKFTLIDLINRIEGLMRSELKKYNCTLNFNFTASMDTEFRGDVNNLVQVFDNLIINGIHAYEGKSGNIDFNIKEVDGSICFTVKDYGKGIQADIKNKLFQQMVTTKGKDGTGLGLYISYSTIKGRFKGNMWFESEEGKGTTFYISLPYIKKYEYQEAVE